MFKRDVLARNDQPDKIDTIIAHGAEVTGTLKACSGLRVGGRVEGQVLGTGDVIIGTGAEVVGDINGRNISVSGTVRGNIAASAKLEIAPSGVIIGDVNALSLVVNEGGRLDGRSQMKPDTDAAPELED